MCDAKRWVCLALSFSLSVVSFSTARSDDLAARRILAQRLKERDDRFDRVKLDYRTWGTYTPEPFPFWKFPAMKPEPEEKLEPMDFRFLEQMVIRGDETTFVRQFDPALAQKNSSTQQFVPYQKWSNGGGLSREIVEVSSGKEWIMDIRKRDPLGGLFPEQRMEIEFAHGFGFGKRIKEIKTITRAGATQIVEGSINMWDDDVSKFRIELDDDLVVKKAEIDTNTREKLSHFEIRTEGKVERAGFVFAKTGHFKRVSLGIRREGRLQGEPHVVKEFSTTFGDVKFHLNDAQYESLVEMEIPRNSQVNDFVANRRYRVDKDGKIHDLGPAILAAPSRPAHGGDPQ